MSRGSGPFGRSTLLRAGLAPEERPRNRVLRHGAILAVAGLIVGLVLVVGGERLSKDGPGRLLYLIHDTVWLPLYGRFWTAVFPDALIWLAVVCGVATVVLVEFLGIASPLRRLQVMLLRVLLPAVPGPVVAMHGALRASGLRSGLAEQVLRDLRDEALHPFTVPGAAPGDDAYARLCRLQALQLAFGLQSSRDLVAVVDVLGLAAVEPGARDDAAAALRRAAARLKPDAVPFWAELTEPGTFRPDLSAILQATADLETATIPAEALACCTVRVAAFLGTGGDAAALVWFDAWARLRTAPDGERAARLAEAEALCAFEYWAALAEKGAHGRTTPDFLAEAFPGLHLLRPRGEQAAAEAVLSGGGA